MKIKYKIRQIVENGDGWRRMILSITKISPKKISYTYVQDNNNKNWTMEIKDCLQPQMDKWLEKGKNRITYN